MIEEHPADISGLATGDLVAGYRLEAKIGEGGMAVVYRARDERLRRLVALKLLAPALWEDPAFRLRFMAESAAIAAVDHPHIIPVYDCGENDGVLFIAMRFVSGGDLRRLMLREGALQLSRTAAIISPVASALDAAHHARIVHRDVKPGNILIDAGSGRPDYVLLSDFGVSKSVATSVALTGTGQFIGTAGYAAPEQVQELAVDGRADQYALACVTYELLTARPVFERQSMLSVLIATVHEQPPALTALRPDLPAAADDVMARALAKAPADRYPTCTDFTEALRAACGLPPYYVGDVSGLSVPVQAQEPDEPGEFPELSPTAVDDPGIIGTPQARTITIQGTALPEPAIMPDPAPTRPDPVAVPDAVVATPELPTAAPVTAGVTDTPSGPAPEPPTVEGETSPQIDELDAPAAEPAYPLPELAAPVQELAALVAEPDAAIAEPEADSGVPGDQTPQKAPAGHWRRRLPLAVGAAAIVAAAVAVPLLLQLSPGTVRTQTSPTPSSKHTSAGPTASPTHKALRPTQLQLPANFTKHAAGYMGQISAIAVNPAGTILAIAGFNEICLWNIARGVCTATTDPAESVAFNRDGGTLASSDDPTRNPGSNGIVRLASTANGKQVRPVPAVPNSAGALSIKFSPNGKTLAVGDQNGHAYLLDLATDRWTQLPNPGGGPVNAVAFNPSGTELVGADQNGHTYLWNVATGQRITTLPGSAVPDGVQAVAYSADGQWLATGNANGTTNLWAAANGTPVGLLRDVGGTGVFAVAFSPNNTTLAVGDTNGTVYLWNVKSHKLIDTLVDPRGGAGGVTSLAFYGSHLVTGYYQARVDIWNIGSLISS